VSWRLLGADGEPYLSDEPGTLGGHRRTRIYGQLDCPSALRAIARGGYVAQRVFFAAEADAVAAGYRPCGVCMPTEYARWKAARASADQRSASRCTRSTTTSSRSA
jgi:methylphosphotriester-DNA--protein-cysteine methyltransferase